MNVKIKIGDLLAGLDIVNGTVDRKGNDSPVYFFAEKNELDPKDSTIKVYSTSFSQGESLTVIKGEVAEPGNFALHADQLFIGLQGKDKEEIVTISSQNDEPFKIKTKRSQFKALRLVNFITSTKEPLKHLPLEAKAICSIEIDQLLEMLKTVESAAAPEDNKASGYLLQSVKLVIGKQLITEATDTMSAACSISNMTEVPEQNFLIPPNVMKLLTRFVKKDKKDEEKPVLVSLKTANNKLYFQHENSILGVATFSQMFPPVRKLFDAVTDTTKVIVQVNDLKSVVGRAIGFLGEELVNLSFKNDAVWIKGTSSNNTFEEYVDAEGSIEWSYKIKGSELVKLLNSVLSKTVEFNIIAKPKTPLYMHSKSASGVSTRQVISSRV
jgi:hypothetical protein